MRAGLPASIEERLISLLQKCRQQKDPWRANRLQEYLREQQLETHPALCNYLVPMLADCGRLLNARQVFDQLPLTSLNEHSWNSLISGYVNCEVPHHAFLLYYRMQEQPDCVRPSACTYLSLLSGCARLKDVERGRRVHAEIVKRGLGRLLHNGSAVLGNTMVDMYGKCGSLMEAHYVFHCLPARDVVSWNALIAGYGEHGLNEEATNLFHEMQLQDVSPNTVTYLACLKACSSVKALGTGEQLHAHLTLRGLESELSLGSILVDMYSKCGSLAEAHEVLDALHAHDTVLWNTLIAGYSEYGLKNEAWESFQRMQLEGVCPDFVTFLCCIKACFSVEGLEELHAEVIKRGFESDISMGSTLVDICGKFGLISEARQVFDRLPARSVVSWATLIAGYIEHGLAEESWSCFQQMQEEGISPDSITFFSCLNACGNTKATEIGQDLHSEVIKRGLERDSSLGNALVDMYGKFGFFADAHLVFDVLPARHAGSWAALVAAYAEHGCCEEFGERLEQMQREGISPDLVMFITILKSCVNRGALETGRKLHAEVTKRGLERGLSMGSTLVGMYGKCDLLAEACQVFLGLPAKDAVLWNTLILGYAEHGRDEDVLNCFKQMQLSGVCADRVSFICFLRACGVVGALELGREIHAEIRKNGLESDLFVGSMLIDMYGRCGSVEEGQEAFDKLHRPDVVSWTAIIKAYGENNKGSMAVACFDNMQRRGVKPDSTTYTCLLSACSHGSLVLEGQDFFKLMIEEHKIEPTMDHYACMVDLLARSGHVCEAERFIAAMQCPPSSEILRSLLTGCKICGKVEVGQKCFQQIVELDVDVGAACLLMEDLYNGVGRWSDAKKVEDMRKDAGAKKRPGTAVIEVNRELHEFVVGVNHMKDLPGLLDSFGSCMKDVGYVPNVDIVLARRSNEEKTVFFERVDNLPSLTRHKNLVYGKML